MSARMADVQIKLEGTELQTYLASFNKEIESNDQQTITVIGQDNSDGEEDEEGPTYFIDQTGNYYYQINKNTEPVLAQQSGENNSQLISIENDGNNTGDDSNKSKSNENATSNDDFQSVRFETNDEGVSYVLIMENTGDEAKTTNEGEEEDNEEDQNVNVYEFNENEDDKSDARETDVEDDKTKIVKVTPKKSQTVAQAHMCNYCNYTSPKRYLLSRHMKSHSEERPHKCSVCERGFKTLASLQNHVNTHTGTKPHHCKNCESAFTTSGELVRHVRYRHTHEKPHKCTECNYASVELSKLKRHIRCHTGERPYQCPHCTYASPDTFKLKRHLRIHTGEKPYECDVCHARFTQSNSLKAHKLIHSVGDKPVFHCELCPTTCGRKTDLRIHVQKLHTSDKPLKCKRCGKHFPDRYSYKIHSKTHEGEKCYKCDLCPYASISARHLESHMLIHTDQKPFQCEQCDQSFRQKQLLKRHINLYHNPEYIAPTPKEKTHACPNCIRTFRHKGNLIRHMAVHDPESSIREDAIALKMGRQKRLQMIDGEQVELLNDESSEEECSEEGGNETMEVDPEEESEYVVLEVIQLPEDEEQNADNHQDISGVDFLLPDNLDEEVLRTLRTSKKLRGEPDKMLVDEKEMTSCFGFDEDEENSIADQDDDEDDEDNHEKKHKSTIKLLDIQE